jgi:flagellar assembly protein FliH
MRGGVLGQARGAMAFLPDLGGATPESGADARAEAATSAHAILAGAEAQAQALMEAARRQVAGLLEEGRRDGFRQGQGEAHQAAAPRLAALTEALAVGAATLEELEASWHARAEEVIVELALAVAERILMREIARAPEAILGPVRAALASLPVAEESVIRVHPDLVPVLEAHRAAMTAAAPGIPGLRVQGDPAVAPGGCLVQAPSGLVDATLPGQLGEARRRLLEAAC